MSREKELEAKFREIYDKEAPKMRVIKYLKNIIKE